MIYDNPAARLLSILTKGKEMQTATNCRQAWQQILNVQDNNALLMSRLGKIMELPAIIIQSTKDNFPSQDETWTHWEAQVNQAFMVQNLNAGWDTFIGHIDNHTITYLRMASDLLQAKSKTKSITEEEMSSIRERIDQIYQETLESDIEEEIKKYIVRCLRQILANIDEYHLTGAIPILDSVETMLGHMAVDQGYKSFMTDTDLGKKVLEVLGAMANVVTVAIGLPALSHISILLLSQ